MTASSSGAGRGLSPAERAAYLRGERDAPQEHVRADRLDLMRDRPPGTPSLVWQVSRAEELVKQTRRDLDEAAEVLGEANADFPERDLIARRHLTPQARARYGALRSAEEDHAAALAAHKKAEQLLADVLDEFHTAYPPLRA